MNMKHDTDEKAPWEIDLNFTIDCHTDMNLYELVSNFLEMATI